MFPTRLRPLLAGNYTPEHGAFLIQKVSLPISNFLVCSRVFRPLQVGEKQER